MVKRLQKEGYWVRGVDIKRHEYFETDPGDEFLVADMRDPAVHRQPQSSALLFTLIDPILSAASSRGGHTDSSYPTIVACVSRP